MSWPNRGQGVVGVPAAKTDWRAPLPVLGTLAGRLSPREVVTVIVGDTDPTPPEMSADIPALQVPECGWEVATCDGALNRVADRAASRPAGR